MTDHHESPFSAPHLGPNGGSCWLGQFDFEANNQSVGEPLTRPATRRSIGQLRYGSSVNCANSIQQWQLASISPFQTVTIWASQLMILDLTARQ
jgi:hypothetical protein